MAIKLYIAPEVALPDNDQWQFRFTINSETSDRVYTIAQHKKGRYWGCSCPGFKGYGYCKHLRSLGLPVNRVPYEPDIIRHK